MSERKVEASARRRAGYTHDVEVERHSFVVDEPPAKGGDDRGPSPTQLLAASLASCTAVTVEMYADRKGWDVGDLEVAARFEPGERGRGNSYRVELVLPADLDDEQVERIVTIAGRCPVARALVDRETVLEHHVERA